MFSDFGDSYRIYRACELVWCATISWWDHRNSLRDSQMVSNHPQIKRSESFRSHWIHQYDFAFFDWVSLAPFLFFGLLRMIWTKWKLGKYVSIVVFSLQIWFVNFSIGGLFCWVGLVCWASRKCESWESYEQGVSRWVGDTMASKLFPIHQTPILNTL